MLKTLFLSSEIPHPPNNGGAMRVGTFLSAFLEKSEVHFAAVRRSTGPVDGWAEATRFAEVPRFFILDRSGDHGAESLRSRVGPIFGLPRYVSWYDSREMWQWLESLDLASFDVVHGTGLGMAPYVASVKRRRPQIIASLDLPDIMSVVGRRRLSTANPKWISLWRLVLVLEILKTTALEKSVRSAMDRIWVCSSEDRDFLPGPYEKSRVRVVPNTVDVPSYAAIGPAPTEPRLLFPGDLGYGPNEQGVLYFCRSILPQIAKKIPDVQFLVVGRNPTEEIRQVGREQPGVRVVGEVKSMFPYLADCRVVVVPLLVGGGSRLKIIEAMAARRPVVSTSIGAEGLEIRFGRDLLIADNPQAFANHVVDILTGNVDCPRMIESAAVQVAQNHDWPVAERRIMDDEIFTMKSI